eukprot:363504-Chlamydomonas_euryale.AAC.9
MLAQGPPVRRLSTGCLNLQQIHSRQRSVVVHVSKKRVCWILVVWKTWLGVIGSAHTMHKLRMAQLARCAPCSTAKACA